MNSDVQAHCLRVEQENLTEGFMTAPIGTLATTYSAANLDKPLTEPGWCRLWCLRDGDSVIASASVYDLAEPDRCVFGHISIEKPYRSKGYARLLQALRFKFLDKHQLTLCGAVAHNNWHSLVGCLRNGFQFLKHDSASGEVWVYRSPILPE